MAASAPPALILASTSVYRRELLQRLRLPFETARPRVAEDPLPGESPVGTAERLALAKAQSVAGDYMGALIIGSDQVAYAGSRVYGKPLGRERAIAQLQELSGQVVVFHTALCLFNSVSARAELRAVPTAVRFRVLPLSEIERYVDADQPFDCAGSARSEGLGIGLLEYVRGDDPTALIGLPLIALCEMLRNEGIRVP